MAKLMRLDKLLSEMSVGTRSEVKQMIKKGRITVDGVVVKKPEMKVDPDHVEITAEGRSISYAKEEYIMLHKPAGVVSATKDAKDKTVLDLITDSKRKDLFPVGRLDKDTEGLLLLTSDGELAHQLLSPKKHVDKTYYAKIRGIVDEEDVKKFAEGLDIGEESLTLPAKLVILDSNEESKIEVTIQEGKFHQIKRMFHAVGKEVVYLKRLSMGSLVLDETLEIGAYRPLSEEEIRNLKNR
ncbi:MAG: rRNA pseudouridine synthase [Lachnospiraceae bacterium]|nr:rRNA pseudouridine synthase [Lachnospiraceae bacterium]